jgi:hypothetical protein
VGWWIVIAQVTVLSASDNLSVLHDYCAHRNLTSLLGRHRFGQRCIHPMLVSLFAVHAPFRGVDLPVQGKGRKSFLKLQLGNQET